MDDDGVDDTVFGGRSIFVGGKEAFAKWFSLTRFAFLPNYTRTFCHLP